MDGDACPVKDETYDVAIRYGVRVSLVANSRMNVPAGLGVEMVVVDQGPDAADDWIAAGATIVGGCCRIGPEQISAMAQSVNNRR